MLVETYQTNRTSLPNLPERLDSTNMDLQTNSELWYCTNVWGRDEFFNCFPGNWSQYLEIKAWILSIKFQVTWLSHKTVKNKETRKKAGIKTHFLIRLENMVFLRSNSHGKIYIKVDIFKFLAADLKSPVDLSYVDLNILQRTNLLIVKGLFYGVFPRDPGVCIFPPRKQFFISWTLFIEKCCKMFFAFMSVNSVIPQSGGKIALYTFTSTHW